LTACKEYQRVNFINNFQVDYRHAHNGEALVYLPGHIMPPSAGPLPKDGWESYCKWRQFPKFVPGYLEVDTDTVTQYLTVAHALNVLNLTKKPLLVIHVLGADHYEITPTQYWEVHFL
jgi:hypothetical protein